MTIKKGKLNENICDQTKLYSRNLCAEMSQHLCAIRHTWGERKRKDIPGQRAGRCTVRVCIVQCCTALYRTAVHYTTLQQAAVYSIILHFTALNINDKYSCLPYGRSAGATVALKSDMFNINITHHVKDHVIVICAILPQRKTYDFFGV